VPRKEAPNHPHGIGIRCERTGVNHQGADARDGCRVAVEGLGRNLWPERLLRLLEQLAGTLPFLIDPLGDAVGEVDGIYVGVDE
jgi:hypothetical protein